MLLLSNLPSPARSPEERRFVRHIGLHHFAYLRAVAEGLDIAESAARYLGTEHGHEARWTHQQTVDAVRSTARRPGEGVFHAQITNLCAAVDCIIHDLQYGGHAFHLFDFPTSSNLNRK